MKISTPALLCCAAAVLLCACGKSSSPTEPAPSQVQSQAKAAAVAAGVPAEALNGQPPAGVSGAVVDACAMLDRAAAAALVGALVKEPEADTPRGSLLGGCKYQGAQALLTLSAHPAGEYQGTLDYTGKNGSAKPVAGLGAQAAMTPYGLMIQPAAKPYFVVVYVMKNFKFDETAALAAGHQLKL
jgi:hypothetical protein